MEQDADRKTGNFATQIEVEKEVRARVYAARMKDKAFQRIAGDETHPTRKITHLHRKARKERKSFEQTRALFIEPLEEELKQLFRRTTGEFPAA